MTKRQIFNGWQKTDMNSDAPYECSSNFTNTTSWAKELGAIALPTFKNWGGGGGGEIPFLLLKLEGGGAKLPPFLALNLRKTTVLL